MRGFGFEALRCPIDGKMLGIKQEERWEDDDLLEGKLVCAEGHEWSVLCYNIPKARA